MEPPTPRCTGDRDPTRSENTVTQPQRNESATTGQRSGGSGILRWNSRQIRFLLKYGSLYHVPLTADSIAPLALRYAERHANTRPRMLQQPR